MSVLLSGFLSLYFSFLSLVLLFFLIHIPSLICQLVYMFLPLLLSYSCLPFSNIYKDSIWISPRYTNRISIFVSFPFNKKRKTIKQNCYLSLLCTLSQDLYNLFHNTGSKCWNDIAISQVEWIMHFVYDDWHSVKVCEGECTSVRACLRVSVLPLSSNMCTWLLLC